MPSVSRRRRMDAACGSWLRSPCSRRLSPRRSPRPVAPSAAGSGTRGRRGDCGAGAGTAAEWRAPPRTLRSKDQDRQRDGSKRLLGNYDDASLLPERAFVVATEGRRLVAVEPDGDVRWTVTSDAGRGCPLGAEPYYHVAYRGGTTLRVVGGDGEGDRLPGRERCPGRPGVAARRGPHGARLRLH